MKTRHADVQLFLLILLLTVFGAVMVFSASAPRAISMEEQDAFYFLKRHAVYGAIGLGALLVTWSLDYRIWRRLLKLVIAGAVVADLLLYVPGLRVEALGAARWVSFGFVSYQPSEILKFAAIVLLAHHFATPVPERGRIGYFIRGGLFAAVPFLLILIQPDLGSAAIVGIDFLLAVLVSGLPIGYFITPFVAGLAALPFLILLEPYRVKRVFAFLDPWKDPLGAGFQTIQSLFSFASGGILGLGIGASRQKHFYLPQAHTDFIFAVIGEELGLVGASALVCLFALLALMGFWVSSRAPDRFGMILGMLITGSITAQAFINMAVNVGLMPVKGFPLPLISYGGTSLIITLASLGILLNIAAQGSVAAQGSDDGADAPAPGDAAR